MILKERTGAFLCPGCGERLTVRNEMAQRQMERGIIPHCDNCRRGRANGKVWQSYEEYRQSDIWERKAARCKALAGNRCQLCNSSENLEAHHRRYPKVWGQETQADLTCLCADCHSLFHAHRKLHVG